MSSISIILGLLAVFSRGSDCSSFTCSTTTAIDNVCIAAGNVLHPCPSGNICNIDSNECVDTSSPSASDLPAGVACNSTFTCRNTCDAGICTGLPVGSSCSDIFDCDKSSYCYMSVCTALGAIGASCLSDDNCVQGSGCINSVCTAYYSIPNGGALPPSRCSYSTSAFCESGQCWDSGTEITCIEAFKSTSSTPLECETDEDCTAVSGEYSTVGTCLCSLDTKSYCTIQLGDPDGVNFLNAHKSWVLSDEIKLCSDNADTLMCMRTHWRWDFFIDYGLKQYLFMYKPRVVGVDECVIDILESEFDFWKEQSLSPPPAAVQTATA